MRTALRLVIALLFLPGLAGLSGCGHAPDGRTVQQAVDDAAAGR